MENQSLNLFRSSWNWFFSPCSVLEGFSFRWAIGQIICGLLVACKHRFGRISGGSGSWCFPGVFPSVGWGWNYSLSLTRGRTDHRVDTAAVYSLTTTPNSIIRSATVTTRAEQQREWKRANTQTHTVHAKAS